MKKGFYFIGTHQKDKDGNNFYGPRLDEGSFENHGKLFIHREKDYQGNPSKWTVTHKASGASILPNLDLKSARLIANELQPFTIWDIEKFTELQATIADAGKDTQHPYHEEYKAIMRIRFLRA